MDGAGLSLLVQRSGSRSWVLRYQLDGKRRDMGLGSYPEVTLAKARQLALDARRLVRIDRRDPVAERKQAKLARALTFEKAAEQLLESKRPGWGNAKHAWQWGHTLRTLVYPELGAMNVSQIETSDVVAALRPIWIAKPTTASRVRRRIEAVLDYATAMGKRSGANPARWKGHLDHSLPKPGKVRATKHHAALDWREAPTFTAELAKREGVAAKVLAVAFLTAARSGEVRSMKWAEIDDDAMVWTVPANRMKAGKEHRVPLTPAARALLGPRGDPGTLVFPSQNGGARPLCDTAPMAALRRMGRGDLTMHGLRSTFRDWAGETTAHPREVIEAALAHRLKDKAEAAYARGDLFTKRRRLMEDWAVFLARPAADVLELPLAGEREAVAR